MAQSRIVLDDNGRAVPVMGLLDGGYQAVSFTATTARSTTLEAGERAGAIARLWATQDCHIAIGDSTVEATTSDHFIPASQLVEVYLPAAALFIAVIRATADGVLHISQLDGTP